MRVKAYAKINLRLKILGINHNQYHLLQMVNTKIDLYDSLEFKKIRNKEIIVDMPLVAKEHNLVYKVANKMFDKYNLPRGIYIKIEKKIPIGAGLGGGSTDAAKTIEVINKLYKLNLTKRKMTEIALEFGTDIVYCLENDLALVEGIGEKITLLKRKIKKAVLVINPNIFISAKDIYDLYDKDNTYSKMLSPTEIENMSINTLLENDLEKVVFKEYPEVKKIKDDLQTETSLPVLMSGSGSTIFVLGDKREIKRLYKLYKLKYRDYKIYITKTK